MLTVAAFRGHGRCSTRQTSGPRIRSMTRSEQCHTRRGSSPQKCTSLAGTTAPVPLTLLVTLCAGRASSERMVAHKRASARRTEMAGGRPFWSNERCFWDLAGLKRKPQDMHVMHTPNPICTTAACLCAAHQVCYCHKQRRRHWPWHCAASSRNSAQS